MIGIVMASAMLFGGLLLFGTLGLLVEWIAYRMEVRERKKVKAAVWRLKSKDDQEAI